MDPAALPGFLDSLKGNIADAAAPVADAMAETFQHHVVNVTLKEHTHAPGMYYEATRGATPAYVTGNLARSVIRRPASGMIRATAMVGDTAVYAAVQEFGGETWPSHGKYMHWRNSRGPWWMKHVTVPEHPYFRPALEAVIRDGSLRRSAISAFEAFMSPLIR